MNFCVGVRVAGGVRGREEGVGGFYGGGRWVMALTLFGVD